MKRYCKQVSKKNKKEIQGEMEEAGKQYTETGRASRVYKDFFYKTVKRWSLERRVVGKAEP
ncbi:conserved hypothetical protein [Candidatus Brocadia pituitae]|nr:conserved hypothetical protein [Candidatus Brocadia pituitae]